MTTLTPMPRRLLPLVVIFMAGWLALDLRWQFGQVRNLAEARDEFAGVPLERRWGASLGPLAGVLDEIRDGLPDGGRILFATLDDDPDVARYMALTARYYLLPHDVMPTWKQQGGMENMITRLAPGDHLLFLKSDGPVRSKAPDSAVPVSRTRHSALYRIER